MSQGLVIPCYNEASRLPKAQIDELLLNEELTILLVDDGSKDQTREMIEGIARNNPRIRTLILPQNQGKAEAVRQGLLKLSADGYRCVGYADADFATPAYELLRLMSVFESKCPQVLMGSRVRLLGTEIDRRMMRHYLGRVFATMASFALRLPVYDTQCGAKFFENNDNFKTAISSRFTSRWAFDVELLGRLCGRGQLADPGSIIEVPLQKWVDVAGSKLKASSMLKAGWDLLVIGFRLRFSG